MIYIKLFEDYNSMFYNTNYKNIIFDNDNYEYFVRYTNHIEEDLERGWSSWNFGSEGYEGTKEDLLNDIEKCKDTDGGDSIYISGFDLWIDKDTHVSSDIDTIYIKDNEIKELYDNYWVLVDNVNT